MTQEHFLQIGIRLDQIKNQVESGDLSPLEAYIETYKIKKDAEALVKHASINLGSLTAEATERAKEYGNSYGGFTWEYRKGRTTYDFKEVSEVVEAKSKAKGVEDKYKRAFLMRQKNEVLIDAETGEEIDPSKVKVKYSSDSLILKPEKRD